MIDEAAVRQQMRSAASGKTDRQQEFIPPGKECRIASC
jgi:hypothetical protein